MNNITAVGFLSRC